MEKLDWINAFLLGIILAFGPVLGVEIRRMLRYRTKLRIMRPRDVTGRRLIATCSMAGVLSGAASVVTFDIAYLTGLIVVVGIVAVTGTVGVVSKKIPDRRDILFSIGGMVASGLIGVAFGALSTPLTLMIVTFFVILPAVNGVWDWLSLWVSRWLGRDLLTKLQPAKSPSERVRTVILHAMFDLIAAILLLAAMAHLLALGFAGYNQAAIALSGEARGAFDLEPFIERAAAAPWTDGLWLTVMLISTLVPTFLHMIMLLASPIALAALPTDKRLALAADLETYADQPERHASIRRRAGQYVAREKHGALALATFLFVLLLAVLSWLVKLIHQGGLADYVLAGCGNKVFGGLSSFR